MNKNKLRSFALDLSPYFFGLLFVGTVVIYQYGFYLFQFIKYPLGYQADGLFTMSIAKMYSENGIFFGSYSEQLNYPYYANLDRWYPVPEKLIYYPFAILTKLFGVFSAANAIQLISHILSALGFIFAARFLGVTRKYAFLGGVVFGLTPFIFSRGLAHLTVGAAWLVPIMSVVLLKLMEVLEAKGEILGKLKWISIICAVLGAGLSPYYSFMFGQFLGFLLLISLLKREFNFSRFIVFLIALMVISFTIFNIAYLINAYLYRPASIRNLAALEVYGLKLPELFLPAGFNRLRGLAGFAQQNYYLPAFVKGELWSPYLGLIGVIACFYFIGSQFYLRFIKEGKKISLFFYQATWITVYSLIGGINLIAGVVGFQFIRATNRYSIWLLAIFLLYSLYRVSKVKVFDKTYIYIIFIFITFLLVWVDMPPAYNASSRNEVAKKINADKELIAAMEAVSPAPKIFVLPEQVFPENGPANKMLDYDFLRLFLNSNSVKISYGGVKLDSTTPISSRYDEKNNEKKLENLFRSSYDFICINKYGYTKKELDDLINILNKLNLKFTYENSEYILVKITKNNVNKISRPEILFSMGWSEQEPNLRWAINSKPKIIFFCREECSDPNESRRFTFNLQSYGEERNIKIYLDDRIIWSGLVTEKMVKVDIKIEKQDLNKEIIFNASGQSATPGANDQRKLYFNINDIQIK